MFLQCSVNSMWQFCVVGMVTRQSRRHTHTHTGALHSTANLQPESPEFHAAQRWGGGEGRGGEGRGGEGRGGEGRGGEGRGGEGRGGEGRGGEGRGGEGRGGEGRGRGGE